MKILLLKDVKSLGKKGEIKDVSDGYGKNFLIPKDMGIIATDSVIKQQESKIKKEKFLNDILIMESKEIKEVLEEEIFDISLKGNTKSTIKKAYGSLKKEEISERVNSFLKALDLKYVVDEKDINLDKENKIINTEGIFNITILLEKGIKTLIKVRIKIVD